MRQRSVKNLEEKLIANQEYLINNPGELKGKWHDRFNNDNPIVIELGCGKGRFIKTLANFNPNINYIAFEGQANVIVRALEKVSEDKLENVLVVNTFVNDLNEFFEHGEIEGVYLNFSDPWPKLRHAKRRLIYHKRILNYIDVMKKGFISFKTDNKELFDFAISELELLNIKPKELTYDLHNSNYNFKNFTTEYEEKFKAQGKNIMYYKVEV